MGNSLPGVGAIAKNWREVLKPEEYAVLREGGTERAFSGEYWNTHTEGVYSCRACGTELFRSDQQPIGRIGWLPISQASQFPCALLGGHDLRYAPRGGALRRLRFAPGSRV